MSGAKASQPSTTESPVAAAAGTAGEALKPIPDHALVRENRVRVREPDLALDESADGFDGPADTEQCLAADGGGVALHLLGQRLRQRGEHVERGLRPALGQLQSCEQHGARLLLRDGCAVARFA